MDPDPDPRLRAALEAHAGTLEPDLDRLWACVRDRIDEPDRVASTRRRWLVPAAAAVLVAALAGTTALVASSGPDSRVVAAVEGPEVGPVGPEWACPDHPTYAAGRTLPPVELDLASGGGEGRTREAVERGVQRVQLVRDGDTAQLRYGDDAGRLQAVTELRRAGDRWQLVSRTLCSGPDGSQGAPVEDPAILAEHVPAGDPPPVPADATVGEALLVDARPFYDQTGQLRTQDTWVRRDSSCRAFEVRCISVIGIEHGGTLPRDGTGASGDFDAQPNCGRAVVSSGLVALLSPEQAPGPWLCSLYVTGEEPVSVTVRTPDETVTLRRWKGSDWDGAWFAGTIREFPGNRAFNFEFTSTYADGRTKIKRY